MLTMSSLFTVRFLSPGRPGGVAYLASPLIPGVAGIIRLMASLGPHCVAVVVVAMLRMPDFGGIRSLGRIGSVAFVPLILTSEVARG